MSTRKYKSTPARLARVFRRSRDTWKRRAAAKQRASKKLRITVRDLSDSREHWKSIARQQSQQVAALRVRLDQTSEAPNAGGA